MSYMYAIRILNRKHLHTGHRACSILSQINFPGSIQAKESLWPVIIALEALSQSDSALCPRRYPFMCTQWSKAPTWDKFPALEKQSGSPREVLTRYLSILNLALYPGLQKSAGMVIPILALFRIYPLVI